MKKNNLSLIFGVLVFMALAGSLALIKESQDTRSGAAFSTGKLFLLPDDKISFGVNQNKDVSLWVDSGSVSAKVDAIRAYICYNGDQVGFSEGEIKNYIKQDSAFDTVIATLKDDSGKKCLDLSILSVSNKASKGGSFKIADITFKGTSVGIGNFEIVSAKSEMSGDNPGSNDKQIAIGSVAGVPYEVLVSDQGNWPILNFKFSFSHVRPAAVCAVGWPVQVVVKSENTTKSYSVTPVRDGDSVNKFGDVKYKVENLVLNDFPHTEKVSVFLKGSKHMQMKYGKDKQDKSYNKVEGELVLKKDNTSPFFDFSNYPILPGDVSGDVKGTQDGKIDSKDFVYVKDGSLTLETVSSEQNLYGDLNGDCQINSGDVVIFKNSLKEKQDQLY